MIFSDFIFFVSEKDRCYTLTGVCCPRSGVGAGDGVGSGVGGVLGPESPSRPIWAGCCARWVLRTNLVRDGSLSRSVRRARDLTDRRYSFNFLSPFSIARTLSLLRNSIIVNPSHSTLNFNKSLFRFRA